MNDSPYLTTEAAAARLCVSPTTLERLRVRGDGPPFIAVSLRRIVYEREALDAWARSRAVQSARERSAA